MTRSSPPPLLLELQNSNSLSGQLAALRALKNELIGAEQRKKSWISLGIIPLLSQILQSRRRHTGKRIDQDANSVQRGAQGAGRVLEDDLCRLQAVEITGSMAQAGSQFVGPVLASNLLVSLVSNLASDECPISLAVAILKTLNTIAERLPNSPLEKWPQDQRLASLLYSKDFIGILPKLIGHNSDGHRSMSLAATLLCNTVTTESQKVALVDAGILDALSTRLAVYIVSQGFVLPGADLPDAAQNVDGARDPKFRIAPILQATALMIDGSNSRANHFLSTVALNTVFPKSQTEIAPSEIKKSPWGSSTYLSGSAVPRLKNFVNPIDALLPTVPFLPSPANHNHNFPPPGPMNIASPTAFQLSPGTFGGSAQSKGLEDGEESAIIPWLIHSVRSESSLTQIMAAKLLICFFRLGRTRRDRAAMFCMLLVPLLVRLLDKDFEFNDETPTLDNDVLPARLRVREEAPSLLAALIMDDKPLQLATFEAKAIKKLSLLLKETFDPLPNHSPGMWTPQKTHSRGSEQSDPALRLGSAGPTPRARHIMKFREGILKAMASIAAVEDSYRKALCDQGVVPYIIDSLKPYTGIAPISQRTHEVIPGNSAGTLLAACGITRALSRSINVLRTDLVDAGIATPLIDLLREPDIDVQIAATAVLCNLALDFSPMKQAISHEGIIRLLAEHAHHGQQRLRIESVWALKHIVYLADAEVKMYVFQHLEGKWIKEIVASEYAAAPYRPYHDHTRKGAIVGANANGEHVDILNPTNNDGDSIMYDLGPTSKPRFEEFKRNIQARRLAQAEAEEYTDEARNDDVALQEQTIDLLRNMFCGHATQSVVDHVWREMGDQFFLVMLTERLKPRIFAPKYRSSSTAGSSKDPPPSKTVQPRVEIVIAVTYLLIHIAAGESKHRRMHASNHELLKLTSGLLEHPNSVVRRNVVVMVVNMLCVDSHASHAEVKDKAQLLETFLFQRRLRALQDDPVLDVRERVKAALTFMDNALGKE